MLDTTNIESQSLSLIDKIARREAYRIESFPTVQDLQEIAKEGQKRQREFGVQLYITEDEKGTTFNSGAAENVFEPEPPSKLRDKIRAGIFFHSHPIKPEDQLADGKIGLHIMPSEPGDFKATIWSRRIAGYFNILTEHGMTLNVSAEGVSRNEDILRRLRYKAGEKELANEKVWKILTGSQAGQVIVGEQSKKVSEGFNFGHEDVVAFSHTDYSYIGVDKVSPIGTIRHFVFISWQKLEEMQEIYGNLENLCFGKGTRKLIEHLGFNIPCEDNLGIVARKPYQLAKKRGVE